MEQMSDKLDAPPPVFESPKYLTRCKDCDKLSGLLESQQIQCTVFPWLCENHVFLRMSDTEMTK